MDNAIYLPPKAFIALARTGLLFPTATREIWAQYQRFGGQLPVAKHFDYLIPQNLTGFPATAAGNRWDLMVSLLYPDVCKIVTELQDYLSAEYRKWSPPPRSRAEAGVLNYVMKLRETTDLLGKGGAYCRLLPLLSDLTGAATGAGSTDTKYADIDDSLRRLKPAGCNIGG